MSLDVRFESLRPMKCPHCGEVVKMETTNYMDSGGHGWYPFLESIGYYVPYDQRTEENDWYGKDMTLTAEQVQELYRFVKTNELELYCGHEIRNLVMMAMLEEETVVVNADW